jgi:hypothetical protein
MQSGERHRLRCPNHIRIFPKEGLAHVPPHESESRYHHAARCLAGEFVADSHQPRIVPERRPAESPVERPRKEYRQDRRPRGRRTAQDAAGTAIAVRDRSVDRSRGVLTGIVSLSVILRVRPALRTTGGGVGSRSSRCASRWAATRSQCRHEHPAPPRSNPSSGDRPRPRPAPPRSRDLSIMVSFPPVRRLTASQAGRYRWGHRPTIPTSVISLMKIPC